MNEQQLFPITIPLNKEAHNLARNFALKQAKSEQRELVYRNTLAVWAVNHFLQWMEIDTDLQESESWNPIIHTFNNVADIFIPSAGRLECRPILEGETSIYLPHEVRENRIAYIAVQFLQKLNQVQLLGCYIPGIDESPEQLDIQNLSCLDTLLNHLEWLERVNARGGLTRLKDILERQLGAGWDTVETTNLVSGINPRFRQGHISTLILDNPETINYWIEQLHSDDELCTQEAAQRLGEIGFGKSEAIAALTQLLKVTHNEDTRWQAALSLGKLDHHHPQAAVRQRKQIQLRSDCFVTLVMSCRPNDDGSIRVRVQVYPIEPDIFVPTGCKLAILDESEQVWQEFEAQDKDDYIQKSFDVAPGDRFAVKVGLCYATSHIEHFIC
ncbi:MULTISPECIES: DUF1822 family protein [Calothrix]|uniref:DUF1822 family protein n=2 Tax=Calothrix TaxID=1186 RepID=A0ABR8AD28_9CYAN|nr:MULTISPECIES: DUF1822 family protein [Calothrix]MBD2197629.1 DUF1822 family protein [Calothrix parietina FACHB-288]MBD2227415.1 DUF1822 family protein [Calothrix anomala FACHB-343]